MNIVGLREELSVTVSSPLLCCRSILHSQEGAAVTHGHEGRRHPEQGWDHNEECSEMATLLTLLGIFSAYVDSLPVQMTYFDCFPV